MRVFRIAMFLVVMAFAISVDAQDAVKVAVSFQNLNVANQNLPGADLSVDFRITTFCKWRLGGVLDGAYQYDTNRALDRFQFLGGPQLSYSIGEDRVSVFTRGLFGATRFDQRR